jgi:hypothetical protein
MLIKIIKLVSNHSIIELKMTSLFSAYVKISLEASHSTEDLL